MAAALTRSVKGSALGWGVFLIAYLLAGIYTQWRLMNLFPPFLDFGFYNRALSSVLAGGSPYDVREIGSAFLYPPPALLFIEPFHAIASVALRDWLYTLFNLILVAAILVLVSRRHALSVRALWPWMVVIAGFAPLAESIYFGQINLITLFGIVLLFLYADSLPALAGLGLAIAIVTKASPGLLLVYLLATRKFRTAAWSVAWTLALSLVALWRYGPQSFLSYPAVFRMITHTFPTNVNSQAIAVKLYQILGIGPMGLTQLGVTSLILVIVGLAAALVFFKRAQAAQLPLFALTLFAMVLASNIIWYHHYIYLLFPLLLWVWHERADARVWGWVLTGLLIMQIDRWLLTTGLLSQLFCFATLFILLFRVLAGSRSASPSAPLTVS